MPIRLTVVKGADLLGSTPASSVVDAEPLTIGRDPKSDWVLPDSSRSLSGMHCRVHPEERGFRLSDLSTNGTFLNGSSIRMSEDHLLSDGDHVSLGPYVLQVTQLAGTLSPPRPGTAAPVTERVPVDGRGGDPAAMALAPKIAEPASMTVIQPARKPAGSAPPPSAATAPPAPAPTSKAEDVWSMPVVARAAEPVTVAPVLPPVPSPQPLPAEPSPRKEAVPQPVAARGSEPSLRDVLARRLGVSADDLPEGGEGELALRLVDLLVEFVGGTRKLVSGQNRLRRDLSCRQTMARRMRGGEAIAMSASDEEAVLALLSLSPDHAQASAADALGALVDQNAALGPAAIEAARSMADLLSPERLSAMMPRQAKSDRLLGAYARLWQDLAPDWDRGFAEAFRLEFGAALDARQSAPRNPESGGRG